MIDRSAAPRLVRRRRHVAGVRPAAAGVRLLPGLRALGLEALPPQRRGDSATWGLTAATDFEPVPRMCRLIMANYEPDLAAPRLLFAPPGGYGIDPACVLRRTTYADTRGRVSPYLLYLDHDHADIVLALRGLNLVKESDYALLVDNRLGKQRFDGGYVHNGLLRAAAWVLDSECDLLKDLLHRYPDYTLTFTGHSLGAGVAAMLTMVVVLNLDKLGNFDRARTRCYAMAPARCMSLNLAVIYADVINSVVLQVIPLSAAVLPCTVYSCSFFLSLIRSLVHHHHRCPLKRGSTF